MYEKFNQIIIKKIPRKLLYNVGFCMQMLSIFRFICMITINNDMRTCLKLLRYGNSSDFHRYYVYYYTGLFKNLFWKINVIIALAVHGLNSIMFQLKVTFVLPLPNNGYATQKWRNLITFSKVFANWRELSPHKQVALGTQRIAAGKQFKVNNKRKQNKKPTGPIADI